MSARTSEGWRAALIETMLRPYDWIQQQVERLKGWFNQERWVNLLTVLVLVFANLVVLFFLLQGQDNRAIAFVAIALVLPLIFFIPELCVTILVIAGSGMFVNILYFAAAPGMGSGERTLLLLFSFVAWTRAIYEYLCTPPAERPRLFSILTVAILLYWVYHMGHVLYIYLFRYNEPPPESGEIALGIYRQAVFRYFDYHILWLNIFAIVILMKNIQRFKRTLPLIGLMMLFGLIGVLWEYFAPLPMFFKVLFQLKMAAQTPEGYRVRDAAPLYLFLVGFFYAIYVIGFLRGRYNVIAILYILLATFGILITKNRILWAGVLAVLPFALFWKPPQALLRQIWVFGITLLVLLASLFHPRVNESVSRIVTETIERWSRNYAFGGDPRLDPSYQTRVREREAWEHQIRTLSPIQRLFGKGLEAGYGRYVSLYEMGYFNPRFVKLYVERVHMHFAWLGRLYKIGWIGTILLAFVIFAFFIRSIYIFFSVNDPFIRAVIVGVAGGTVGVLFFDSLHTLLGRSEALPVVLMWAFVEVIPHWQRTGQLTSNPAVSSVSAMQATP